VEAPENPDTEGIMDTNKLTGIQLHPWNVTKHRLKYENKL